jgi:hypothetical protein
MSAFGYQDALSRRVHASWFSGCSMVAIAACAKSLQSARSHPPQIPMQAARWNGAAAPVRHASGNQPGPTRSIGDSS